MNSTNKFVEAAESKLNQRILVTERVISQHALKQRQKAGFAASGGLLGAVIGSLGQKTPALEGPEGEEGFMMLALTEKSVCFFKINEGMFKESLGELLFEYPIQDFKSFEQSKRRFSFPTQHTLRFKLASGESFELTVNSMPFMGNQVDRFDQEFNQAISMLGTPIAT